MFQDKPRTIDIDDKVRLRACDLRPGMFICELDRPWLETPFLLQGFEVETDQDIEAVMQHCQYVYVDMQRTKLLRPMKAGLIGQTAANRKPTRSFNQDLEAGNNTRSQASKLIKSFADEIRFGKSPDIQLAKSVVSDCISNIVRNPEAMLFLTRLRGKDEHHSLHGFNVCVYSIIIGRLLGFDNLKLENLGTCGLLHDMGKVVIPDEILNKSSKLTDEELEIIRGHTTEGRRILMSGRNIFSGTVDVAYSHHENLDGSGYPRGFEGHQLNLNCKIVAVVDKYDGILCEKPYRPAGDHLSAVAILNKLSAGNKIDRELCSSFVSYLGIYPPGSIVELSCGEIGIVLESNLKQRLRPQILVVRDAKGASVQHFVDMAEKMTDYQGRPYRISSVHRSGEFGIDIGQYYDLIIKAFK
jgi:HD-GYP domain-containing protein (c-di-GMP phosphodiesterase class II)